MNRPSRTFLWTTLLAGLALNASASQPSGEHLLDQGKWAPNTRHAIERLIAANSVPVNTPESKRPYATFDWDDTSIINDVTDKFFLYQIDNLAFKLTPDEFRKVLITNIPSKPGDTIAHSSDGHPLAFGALTSDLGNDYESLYQNYISKPAGQRDATIFSTDEFRDFKTKLYFLFQAIIDIHGAKVAYPWEVFFCSNMTEQDVEDLALSSVRHSLQAGIVKTTLESPHSRPGKTGVVKVSYVEGMRVVPEIADLMHTLQRNGIDVFVVSAGFEPLVKVIATRPEFGYNIPSNQVYGLRLETSAAGKYLAQAKKGHPISYREGKPEVIRKYIAPRREGRDPIFVAGDSNSDFGNFSMLPGVSLGLIVNHLSTGDFGRVSTEAAKTLGRPDARWVLQGVDENIGLWSPTESTTKVGDTQAYLVSPK
ncbi:HAD family hydrolase [Pseudomonas mosselii]|uniref:HAD family hydrolase n=1 Tax=Pseudomonas mosselii TaxID=78327 RepID=UPI00164643FF|nr:HAD-IB family phosphatase [Pseudomonas mosselii]MBC3456944.1 HAD-IB family phosphatase [Pseudomonas mosselii]